MSARARPVASLDAARAVIAAGLLTCAAAAWAVTAGRVGAMAGMGAADLGGPAFYLTVWVAMMAAMMLPATAPAVTAYDRMRRAHHRAGHAPGAAGSALFVGGYLAMWTVAGLVPYAVLAGGRALLGPGALGGRAGAVLAGGVIVAAAGYQLTPLKDACLRRCRGPLVFLAERWTPGRLGAARLGATHGAWCLGCCWMLMAALFALGAMSLGWMAAVAALITAEKLAPWPAGAPRAVAIALGVLGVAVAVVPHAVPGVAVG